jgi:hypothetical protein
MDEAVDQVMGRSSDEKGAEKAVQIRRSQQKERARLQSEITTEQKTIAAISQERAPIAAEVRKVEAEVGPIKYIAKFIYGEHGADENMLEKAVTWIIILIVIVFDPLAVIMLLAAQMTFGWKKDEKHAEGDSLTTESNNNIVVEPTVTKNEYEPDDGPLTDNQIEQIKATVEAPKEETSETPATALGGDITAPEEITVDSDESISELDKWNKMIQEAEKAIDANPKTTVEERVATGETYINNEGQEVPLETTTGIIKLSDLKQQETTQEVTTGPIRLSDLKKKMTDLKSQ